MQSVHESLLESENFLTCVLLLYTAGGAFFIGVSVGSTNSNWFVRSLIVAKSRFKALSSRRTT